MSEFLDPIRGRNETEHPYKFLQCPSIERRGIQQAPPVFRDRCTAVMIGGRIEKYKETLGITQSRVCDHATCEKMVPPELLQWRPSKVGELRRLEALHLVSHGIVAFVMSRRRLHQVLVVLHFNTDEALRVLGTAIFDEHIKRRLVAQVSFIRSTWRMLKAPCRYFRHFSGSKHFEYLPCEAETSFNSPTRLK